MKKIYTYSQKSFKHVKEKIENEGNKLISVIDIEQHKDEFEDKESTIFYMDISSMIKFLKVKEEKIYEFECYLYPFFRHYSNIEYIIEDILLEDVLNIFKFGFSEGINIDLDFTIDNNIMNDKDAFRSIINISREDVNKVFEDIECSLVGHDKFKVKLKEKIRIFRVMNKIRESKILSIFLLGESGIGKSEVARCLQKSLNSNERLAKINLGNHSSKDALNSLIGSPLGYIGSEEGGELTQKIKKSDTGVLLVDEFEKADEKIFNFFLELLEDGKFTNNKGECIDLNEYIIIFTSNLSEEEFFDKVPNELVTRFDYICEFNPLSYDDKLSYMNKKIDEILHKIKNEIQIDIDIDKDCIASKLNQYKDIRNIKRAIIDEISKHIEI